MSVSHRFTATVQEQEKVSSFISRLICSTAFLNLNSQYIYTALPYNSPLQFLLLPVALRPFQFGLSFPTILTYSREIKLLYPCCWITTYSDSAVNNAVLHLQESKHQAEANQFCSITLTGKKGHRIPR